MADSGDELLRKKQQIKELTEFLENVTPDASALAKRMVSALVDTMERVGKEYEAETRKSCPPSAIWAAFVGFVRTGAMTLDVAYPIPLSITKLSWKRILLLSLILELEKFTEEERAMEEARRNAPNN